MESQKKIRPELRVEFLPVKNEEGKNKLRNTRAELAKLNPSYNSKTFGTGGSKQGDAYETVNAIKVSGIDDVSHISCLGQIKEQIRITLQHYINADAHRNVALHRDMPSGLGAGIAWDFRYTNDVRVMPITNCKQLLRFSWMCSAEVPRRLSKRLEDFGDNIEAKIELCSDVMVDMITSLTNPVVTGLHFYCMSKAESKKVRWKYLSVYPAHGIT